MRQTSKTIFPGVKSDSPRVRGFTAVEILVVVALIGVLALAISPSVINTLEKRGLESQAREVLLTMQQTKLRAVKTKIPHRVRFFQSGSEWHFQVEQDDPPGTWNSVPRFLRRAFSTKYNITVTFPDVSDTTGKAVVFSPLGFSSVTDMTQNSITIQSDRLNRYGQPDEREIQVYRGGSIKYYKK